MEMITVWLLSIQFWNDPSPSMKFVYTKEFATHEECLTAKTKWTDSFKNNQDQYQSLCLQKNKNVNTVGR